jgi:tRNA-dihydrouridine synthase
MCQAAGASRLIVHGRFGTQGYSGKADWNAIAEVVQALKIPVIANGDIKDVEHAKECIKQTGAAGVMIGRTLIGAPWNISTKKINHKEIIKYHLKHADNIIEMRKHLIAYCKDKELKKRLALVKSFEEAHSILQIT